MYYHGSKKLFKTFDKRLIGENHHESKDSGFFFTKKKALANVFAQSMTHGEHKPGFVYEVELTTNKPLVRQIHTDWSWTTADYFDVQNASLLQEVRQGRYDSILIEGSNGDDLVVVLEPEQIHLVRVFEGERVIYNHETPDSTPYPDVLGPDAFDPEVNVGTVPFHHDELDDPNRKNVAATTFGLLLDKPAKDALRLADTYSSDGRHFGRGEAFMQSAFALFGNGKVDGPPLTQCRQDCLLAHDMDTGLTLIYDLRKSGESIQALGRRPMVDAAGAIKSFYDDSGKRPSRPWGHIVGPEGAVHQLLEQTCEYERAFTLITHSHHGHPLRINEDGKLHIQEIDRQPTQNPEKSINTPVMRAR